MSLEASAGIEVEGLVREFKNGPRAVDGIHLQVAPGEIYGFLGPNGAGKSTTVLMLTTLLPPTAGTARVAGHDILREGPAVRASIGAALQEAALDPLLTGRDHMRLQTTLQGLPKAERRPRGDELLERVGLTDAADRKVGGYSGGMKRRLDLALALVHRPRVLFLDEPTTGLDPSSRADLWAEVARLAREDGVTVFLTTQYLEEADVLADRVGIIDAGHIVAEGTPESLKAEIGRPSVEAVPVERSDRDAVAEVLSQFGVGRPGAAGRGGGAAGQRRGSGRGRARAGRRRPARGRPPAAPAVARRRVPGQDRPQARRRHGRRAGGRGGLMELLSQTYEMARRSVLQTLRQPAMVIPPILFPLILMGINVSGLDAATSIPGFPGDSYLDFAIAFPFIQGSLFASINAGTAVARDVETGFLNRLALTPMQRSAMLLGHLSGVLVVSLISGIIYLTVGLHRRAALRGGRRRRVRDVRAGDADRAGVRLAGRVHRAAHRLRRGGPGRVPAVLRLPVPVVELAPA